MHPWEFDEYSFNEYLQRRDGFYVHRRDNLQAEYQHFRIVAYWALYPHLKQSAQRKSMDSIIPDIYEPPPPVKGPEWVAEMRLKAKERMKLLKAKLKPPRVKRV